MRGLLILAVLVLAVIVLSRLPAGWRPKRPSAPPRRDELVEVERKSVGQGAHLEVEPRFVDIE